MDIFLLLMANRCFYRVRRKA